MFIRITGFSRVVQGGLIAIAFPQNKRKNCLASIWRSLIKKCIRIRKNIVGCIVSAENFEDPRSFLAHIACVSPVR